MKSLLSPPFSKPPSAAGKKTSPPPCAEDFLFFISHFLFHHPSAYPFGQCGPHFHGRINRKNFSPTPISVFTATRPKSRIGTSAIFVQLLSVRFVADCGT